VPLFPLEFERRHLMRLLLSFRVLAALLAVFAPLAAPEARSQATPTERIEIDANAASHAFPHFWEKMFGSGRAILSLRESYRHDLRETKRITGFEFVRFHAILHDEVGVYDEDAAGKPVYNFSYVDQIYDGLLENKTRPLVELSFMPRSSLPIPMRCTHSGTSRTLRLPRTGTNGISSSKRSRDT
jgi:hypothetical protein